MADLRTQRNLAVGAAVVVAAILIGFLVGRGTRGGSAPVVGQPAGAARPATSPTTAEAPDAAPASTAAAPATPRTPSPAPAVARAERAEPDERRVEPDKRRAAAERAAGERWAQGEQSPADAEPAAAERAEPAPRVAETLTVPDGTQISLALTAPVSSQTAVVGDGVEAELTEAVLVDGRSALPAGTRLSGRVTEATALKKVGGRARLALSFDSALVDGREVPIAAHFAREGKSETGKDAATIAAGTAIGIILGNQAKKNDRGKVIGGVVGAAAGTGIAAATKGETIELPAGTELRLTLRGAVQVRR